jgi:hypothetical protein
MVPSTRHAKRGAWFVPGRRPENAAPSRWRWGWLAVLALAAGYLLFSHGCHGDEDNELFMRLPHPAGEPMRW